MLSSDRHAEAYRICPCLSEWFFRRHVTGQGRPGSLNSLGWSHRGWVANPQNPRVYCVLTMLTGWHEKGAMKKPMVQRCDTAECHWAMCLDIKDIPPVLCFKASGWSFTASPKPMGVRDLLVGLVCLVTGMIRMWRIIPKWPPEFQLFSGKWILIIQPGFWFFDHSIFVHSCSFLFSYPVYNHSMIIIIFIHFPHCIPIISRLQLLPSQECMTPDHGCCRDCTQNWIEGAKEFRVDLTDIYWIMMMMDDDVCKSKMVVVAVLFCR